MRTPIPRPGAAIIGLCSALCLQSCSWFNWMSSFTTEEHAAAADKDRTRNWPPSINNPDGTPKYTEGTLGKELQQQFRDHANFCSFSVGGEDRDYIPEDIRVFIGARDLKTKAESADKIQGGALLYYVFTEPEKEQPLSELHFSPDRIIEVDGESQFEIEPQQYASNYLLTKTCSGYLKASLDANINPPYSAFKAALNADESNNSTIVALSGQFASPLNRVLNNTDATATFALMKLWQIYKNHGEGLGTAYYLKEFQGIMIKRFASRDVTKGIAFSGALDFRGPLSTKIDANVEIGQRASSFFVGRDWKSILYADFNNTTYKREQLFAKLPTVQKISQVLSGRRTSLPSDLMVEDTPHRRETFVPGIPPDMTAGFWEIKGDYTNAYEANSVTLTAQADYEKSGDDRSPKGCRFVLSGMPLKQLFSGRSGAGSVNVKFTIQTREPVDGQLIAFTFDEPTSTTNQPTITITSTPFRPSGLIKGDDGKFRIQWTIDTEIGDDLNVVHQSNVPVVTQPTIQREGQQMPVSISDPERTGTKRFRFKITTNSAWNLDEIDGNEYLSYSASATISLPRRGTGNPFIRPWSANLEFPKLKTSPQ